MHAHIQNLEHISLRAWASLENYPYDGWILRSAEGYTGRANSVQVLDESSLLLTEKIAYCEAWYAERNLPTIFRLTDAMQPPELEDELIERGYHRYNDTLVQTAPLTEQVFTSDERFHYQPTLTDAWLSAWGTWNGVSEAHQAIAKRMLSQQSLPSCYGWINESAVGLAVLENDSVGLFDIVVAPNARGQGIGRALVNSLIAWAQGNGAQRAYLQVTEVNIPALALYHSLGFSTHHRYWYYRKS